MACTVSIGCLCCSKPGPADLRWRGRVLAFLAVPSALTTRLLVPPLTRHGQCQRRTTRTPPHSTLPHLCRSSTPACARPVHSAQPRTPASLQSRRVRRWTTHAVRTPTLATPAPSLLAYLNPPRSRHRTHTGHRTLLDILTSPLSLSVAQKLDAGAPRTRRSAAVPDHLPRRHLPRAAKMNHRRCLDTAQPLPATAGEPPRPPPTPRSSPSLVPVWLGETAPGRRIRSKSDGQEGPIPLRVIRPLTSGPRQSALLFYFSARPGNVSWAGPTSSPRPV
jgi:hypothetical protein